MWPFVSDTSLCSGANCGSGVAPLAENVQCKLNV